MRQPYTHTRLCICAVWDCSGAPSTDIATQKLLESGKYTVVDATWVLECATAGQYREPSVSQIRAANPAKREQMQSNYDQYGDHWLEDTDAEQLSKVCALCVRACVCVGYVDL